MTDARTGRRFPVHLPVRIGDSPVSGEHVGTTANISSSGAYFWLDSPVEVGSIIECEMVVPGAEIGARKDVTLRCLARVIRTDAPKKPGRETGVACVIDAYEFVRSKGTKSKAKSKAKKPKSKPRPKARAKHAKGHSRG